MRVAVEVVDAARIEGGGTPHNAVYLVPLPEQQFGKIGAVLARDTGNQRLFDVRYLLSQIMAAARSEPWRHPPGKFAGHIKNTIDVYYRLVIIVL
jgi:hypothetical protein